MTQAVETTGVELESVGGGDPIVALTDIERQANALKAKVEAAGMVTRIGDREHLGIEALTLAGTMFRVTAHIDYSRPLEDGRGWEARAEARAADGRLVGAGESMCTRDEAAWKRKPDYALRGMAQTRALSRALRGPVGSVVALASYAVTPAEEADTETTEPAEPPALPEWAQPASVKDTAAALTALLEAVGVEEPAARSREIGERIFARCEKTVPVCVLAVLQEVQAVKAES